MSIILLTVLRSTVCTNLVSPDHEPFWRNPKVCNDSMGLPDRTFGNPSKAHHPPKVPTGMNIFLMVFPSKFLSFLFNGQILSRVSFERESCKLV